MKHGPKGKHLPWKEAIYRLFEQRGPDECWPWTGWINEQNGYGKYNFPGGRSTSAHRAVYIALVGDIPEGFVVDHVKERGCTMRHCVNPAHLEAVTQHENLMRADTYQARNAVKTECDSGHPFDEQNTYHYLGQTGKPARGCRICRSLAGKRWREKQLV